MFEVIQHRVGPRILEVATTSGQHLEQANISSCSQDTAAVTLLLRFYGAWSPWRFFSINFEQGKQAP